MADWYAFEEIENALDDTKDLLLPFDRGTWARLLLLVIFTGAGFNLPTGSWNPGTYSDNGDYSQTGFSQNTGMHGAVSPVTGLAAGIGPGTSAIAFLAVIVFGLVLTLIFLNSILSLVYYQSLLDKDVRIRKNFRKNFGKGLSYFIFRLGAALLMITVLAVPILLLFTAPFAGIMLVLFMVPVLILGTILLGLTDNFVLPRMIEADETVLKAWKSIYPDLRNEWRQVLLYVLVRFGLKIAGGVIGFLWILATLLAAIIVFGIITIPFYLASPVLAAIPVIIGIIIWLPIAIAGQIPVQTYLNYYAILVYHDLTS